MNKGKEQALDKWKLLKHSKYFRVYPQTTNYPQTGPTVNACICGPLWTGSFFNKPFLVKFDCLLTSSHCYWHQATLQVCLNQGWSICGTSATKDTVSAWHATHRGRGTTADRGGSRRQSRRSGWEPRAGSRKQIRSFGQEHRVGDRKQSSKSGKEKGLSGPWGARG